MPYNPLTHDPKSGRMLSPMQKMAKSAQLEADTFGQSPVEAQLTKLALGADADSAGVKAYVSQLISLAREHSGSLPELAKMIPLIKETNAVAQKEKVTLSDAERKRIDIICNQLIAIVSQKTSLFRKYATTFKSVARAKAGEFRDTMSDALSQNKAGLFRLAGRMLARREGREQPEGIDRDLLQTRARMLGTAVTRFGGRGATTDYDDDEEYTPRRGGQSPWSGDGGDNSQQILAVLEDIRAALQTGNRQDAEQFNRSQEAAERAADDQQSNVFSPIIKVNANGKTPTTAAAPAGAGQRIMENAGWLLGRAVPALVGGLTSLAKPVVSSIGAVARTALTAVTGAGGAATAGVLMGAALPALFLKALEHDVNRDFSGVTPESPTVAGNIAAALTPKTKPTGQPKRDPFDELLKVTELPGAVPLQETPRFEESVNVTAPMLKNVKPVKPSAPKSTADSPKRVESMRLSNDGFKKLMRREGLPKGQREGGKYTAYLDDGGVWTIGHGLTRINSKPVVPGMTISAAEEEAEVRKQIANHYEPIVRKGLAGKQVPQHVFDSLVSVAYNHERAGRNLARRVAAGEAIDLDDFLASATVHGKRHKGLENRRTSEFLQMAAVAPTGVRNASALATIAQNTPPVVVTVAAPQIAQNSGSNAPMMIPVPIQTENRDNSVQNIRAVNVV